MKYIILSCAALLLTACVPANQMDCCCKAKHAEMKADDKQKHECCKGKKQCPMHQHQN